MDGAGLAGQNIQRTAELQFAVPDFVVQNFEIRATITLRGVGAQIAGGTSSVATLLNDICQASSAAQLNRLFDVQRVEVLKGPQGTLYGRNSTGGDLNVITRGPGKEVEGELSASARQTPPPYSRTSAMISPTSSPSTQALASTTTLSATPIPVSG